MPLIPLKPIPPGRIEDPNPGLLGFRSAATEAGSAGTLFGFGKNSENRLLGIIIAVYAGVSMLAGFITHRVAGFSAQDTLTYATINIFSGISVILLGVYVIYRYNLVGDRVSFRGWIVAPEAGINTSVVFKIAANGDFSASISSLSASPAGAPVSGEPQRAAAPTPYSLRGKLMNGRLQGVIDPLGISFDAPVLSADGPSASSAGFYESTALGSGTGKTFAVVGSGNQVLTLASTPEATVGGVTQLKADRTIEFGGSVNSAPVVVNLKLDPDSTTIEGGVSVSGKTPVSMAGLLNTTLPTDRVINLSSRGTTGNGRTLISGFVISGTAPKRVLLRAAGPALARFGLPSAVANPKLEVFNSAGRVILENDDWVGIESAAAIAQVGAFSLVEGSQDAAILTTLDPGAYTIHVTSKGSDGVALAEIYDASFNPNSDFPRLINISTRGEVASGDGILIGGFVVTGNAPTRVLVRGVGPSLASFGLSGVLADPRLRVYRGSELIAENDDWSSTGAEAAAGAQAASEAGAFGLKTGSKDAALILTLAPGVYTAQISAADGISGGTALVEVYQLTR